MMLQKMSVAQPPTSVAALTTNFQRQHTKEEPHTWAKSWQQSLLLLKRGELEHRSLDHKHDKYMTKWPDWRYNTGKLTRTVMEIDMHNGTEENAGIITEIQYKDWESVMDVNSNVAGGSP